jgi:CRISPR/Cas system CMR-associated protein Cmr5 small subunit
MLTGGLLAAVVALYRAKAQNRVDRATEGLTQAKAWETLLLQMQNRIIEQQREIDDLAEEVAEKDGYIQKIVKIMSARGLEIPTYVFRKHFTRKV